MRIPDCSRPRAPVFCSLKRPTIEAAISEVSVVVKDFFHGCPPLALGAIRERVLHGFHDGPPPLCGWVRGHLAHVPGVVVANVFEVAEEAAVAEKDGVVANVACGDGVEDLRPNGLVMLPVGCFGFRPQTDDHSIALHGEMMAHAAGFGAFERSQPLTGGRY